MLRTGAHFEHKGDIGMDPNRRLFVTAAAGCLAASLPGLARAQAFPSKAVTIIVATPPGGPLDAAARMVGQNLTAVWGVPVVVDHKPGAGGTIAAAALARAPADGHTLLLAQRAVTINASLYKKLPFDTATEIAPVAMINEHTNILVVPKAFPAQNVTELLALLRQRPGQHSFGSVGAGGVSHIAGEMFMRATGTQLIHVPYRGVAPLLNELLAGRLDMTFTSVASVMPQLNDGRVRGLAVASMQRSPMVSDVPTFAELRVNNMNISSWHALFAPGKTPADVMRKINADVVALLRKPETVKWIASQGASPAPALSVDEFHADFRRDIADFAALLKGLNIQPD